MHVGCKAPSPWLCQPISEEPESVEFEEFKRQHRHRPPRNRYLNQPYFKSISYSFTSMSLRADSFNARVRGTSHIDFKTATTGVAAKSMRNELSRLVSTIDDPVAKKVHSLNMPSVLSSSPLSRLSIRKCNTFSTSSLATSQSVLKVLICTSTSSRLIPFHLTFSSDWERIKSPAADQIVPYADLPKPTDSKNLSKLAVLKVNGGLGTSMGSFLTIGPRSLPTYSSSFCLGMTGAKSALEVKDDMTFLDLTVRQIEHLNTTSRVDVPLILMTSFNTHDDTLRIIKKYANQQVRITTFNQSRYPRIFKETLLPCPKRADDDKKYWYPPGHGDLYNALLHSGVLDQLLAEGKEYLFVSNSDNLGAV